MKTNKANSGASEDTARMIKDFFGDTRKLALLKGERHDKLRRFLVSMHTGGVTLQKRAKALTRANDTLCRPPLTDSEIEGVYVDAGITGEIKQNPLKELNKEYAFVKLGGKYRILHETQDHTGLPKTEYLEENTFHKDLIAKRLRLDGGKDQPLTKAWMEWEGRRRYEGVCFAPGEEVGGGFYNLFRGFKYEPEAAGSPEAEAALAAWQEHLLKNICQGDEEHASWVTGWFAHLIQYPGKKMRIALVLRGDKGTGKNVLMEAVGELIQPHSQVVTDRRYLTGNFNSHLETCLMLTLDEVVWSGDKASEGILKGLITGTTHSVERKGLEPYSIANLTRVSMLSNSKWVAPASHDERRYAIFEVGNDRRQDTKFFGGMIAGLEAGGYNLLLDYLLNFRLSGIDLNNAPQTKTLMEQKKYSLTLAEQFIEEILEEGHIPGIAEEFARDNDSEAEIIISGLRAIPTAFVQWARSHRYRAEKYQGEKRNLKALLTEAFPKSYRVPPKLKRQTQHAIFGPLALAREEWEKYLRG